MYKKDAIKLQQKENIDIVAIGTSNDDLGLSDYSSQFVNNKIKPNNYSHSNEIYSKGHQLYSDASKVYLLAGNIKDYQKKENINYVDERRIIEQSNEEIKNSSIKKIKEIEHLGYPEEMQIYQNCVTAEDMMEDIEEELKLILGEDWYLLYVEKQELIEIIDLVKIKPNLKEETNQTDEIIKTLYKILKYSMEVHKTIKADLKEDTSYLLYLMQKKMEYINQISDDLRYKFNNSNYKKTTKEEQIAYLKNIKQIRKDKNKELYMHQIEFEAGDRLKREHYQKIK